MYVELPLHYGSIPRKLFNRMKKLARVLGLYIIDEFGEKEFIKRLSHPLWFQCFSCVLGFDWHSSGSTTSTLYALKEGLSDVIKVIGGKGRDMREDKTFIGKLTCKVDSLCVLDGYNIYIHAIITNGKYWTVINQGMKNDYARRYHWFMTNNFLEYRDKIFGIKAEVLNLTGKHNEEVRKIIVDIINDGALKYYLPKNQKCLYKFPKRHDITISDLSYEDWKKLHNLKEFSPSKFEELLLLPGINEKRIRALSLVANLIYGTELDWKDPAKYSFAHGGKDKTPFPIDYETYDYTIKFFEEILQGTLDNYKYVVKKLKEHFCVK